MVRLPLVCDDPASKPLNPVRGSNVIRVVWIPHSTAIVQFGEDSTAVDRVTSLRRSLTQFAVNESKVAFSCFTDSIDVFRPCEVGG